MSGLPGSATGPGWPFEREMKDVELDATPITIRCPLDR